MCCRMMKDTKWAILMVTFCFILLALSIEVAGQHTNNNDNIHNAVNLGFVLYNQGEVDVVDATARLTFVIELPDSRGNLSYSEWLCNGTGNLEVNNTESGITNTSSRGRVRTNPARIHFRRPMYYRRGPNGVELFSEEQVNATIRAGRSRRDVFDSCNRIAVIVSKLHEFKITLHNSVVKTLEEIHQIITDFDEDTNGRVRRAWLPFLGDIISTVTGVATQGDISTVKDSIKQLEGLIVKSSSVFSEGKEKIQSAVKINSDRIDNLASLIGTEHTEILTLYSEINEMANLYELDHEILTANLHRLSDFVISINQLNMFRTSIERLLAGHLPPDLISHSDVNLALTNLRNHLSNNSHLKIIYDQVQYYYLKSEFVVIRNNNTLIVVVNCPLTSNNNRLVAYRLEKIPLFVQTNFYTLLETKIVQILFHVDEDRYYALTELINVGKTDRQWNPRENYAIAYSQQSPACILSIMRRETLQIKKLCIYHIFNDNLLPFVYQLSNAEYLLSNISQMTVTCMENTTVITPNVPQLVFELSCGCSAHSQQFLLPIHTQGCMTSENITFKFTPRFIINLPLLYEFFSEVELNSFTPDLLLPHHVELELPQFALEEKEYQHGMAMESSAKFKLDEIVNLTKNDDKVYGSLSHFVFNSLLEINDQLESYTEFSLFSKRDLITLLTSIISVICFIAIIILAYKTKQLYMTVAILKTVKAQSYPTMLRYGSSTTTTVLPVQAVMETVWPYCISNIMLVALVIFMIIIFILLIYLEFRRSQRDTDLYLEIGNDKLKRTYFWQRLPGPARFYEFKIFALDASVDLVEEFWRTKLQFRVENLSISQRYLGYGVDMVTRTVSILYHRKKLADLIKTDGYYMAVIIQDRVSSEMVVVRKAGRNTITNVNNVNKASLYPDLSAVN